MRAHLAIAPLALLLLLASGATAEDGAPPPPRAASATAAPTGNCGLAWAPRATTDGSNCLSCHALADTPAGRIMRRHAAGDHGGGIDYQVARRRGALHLRATEELSSEIVLVGGRVTCTSCHDGASGERKHLATRGGMASLCVSCHAL
jgi:predicted CXXCH cytochrome family protein